MFYKKRIERLEKGLLEVNLDLATARRKIEKLEKGYVYKGVWFADYWTRTAQYGLRDKAIPFDKAIELILNHLNLKVEETEATPAKVELKKVVKKSSKKKTKSK